MEQNDSLLVAVHQHYVNKNLSLGSCYCELQLNLYGFFCGTCKENCVFNKHNFFMYRYFFKFIFTVVYHKIQRSTSFSGFVQKVLSSLAKPRQTVFSFQKCFVCGNNHMRNRPHTGNATAKQ